MSELKRFHQQNNYKSMYIEKYFRHYPDHLKQQIQDLIDSGNLRSYLLKKYPNQHEINSDRLLYKYANELKDQYMKNVPQLSKVIYEKQKILLTMLLGLILLLVEIMVVSLRRSTR